MTDPHDLARFLVAQEGVWPRAREEMARGRKTSHWMWFVFPQLSGLDRSETARRYALPSLDAARAYAAHPALGARLREGLALLTAAGDSAEDILGEMDAMKLRSCLTLFALAVPEDPAFDAALSRFSTRPVPSRKRRRALGGIDFARTKLRIKNVICYN